MIDTEPQMPYSVATCQGINGRFYLPVNSRYSVDARIPWQGLGKYRMAAVWYHMLRRIREWRKNVYRTSQYDGYFQTDEWLHLRRVVFRRDGQICQRCDKRFKLTDLNAHHMVPRADGGADDIHNLVTLCEPCHDFVEIQGYRTIADIMGSYDRKTGKDIPSVRMQTSGDTTQDDDEFKRPIWHRWVYGGQKHLRRP